MTAGAAGVQVRAERPDDRTAISDVNRAAFGRDDEATLVDRLRDAGLVLVSLVALDGDRVVGHILFSRIAIDSAGRIVEAAALAPMAVRPERQRQGIGSRLVREGLRATAARGERIAIVLGHEHFYPRFGFSPALARPLRSPFAGDAFMAVELEPGALAGVEGEVRYPAPFGLPT